MLRPSTIQDPFQPLTLPAIQVEFYSEDSPQFLQSLGVKSSRSFIQIRTRSVLLFILQVFGDDTQNLGRQTLPFLQRIGVSKRNRDEEASFLPRTDHR